MSVLRKLTFAALCAITLLAVGGFNPPAEAARGIFFFPDYFPPFASNGTIVEIGVVVDPDGTLGETCTVFLADINGGLYYFNGVDKYAPGTRLRVTGNTCTICLSTLTCGQAVSPIINPVVKTT